MYGTLNVNNIEEFANAILELLDGKVYSFSSANEFCNFKVDTHTNQTLKNGTNGSPLSVWIEEDYAGFNFCDTYGVWGCSTSRKESGYDPDFNSPYIVIEYNDIKITQRAPAGHLLQWTIALQKEK